MKLNEYGLLPNDGTAVPGGLTPDQEDRIEAIVEQSSGLTLNAFYAPWVTQMGENARRGGTTRKSVADFRLPPDRNKDTIIIVGPGASSKEYAHRFPELREAATIIGCPTALYWMQENGLYPDLMVSADSNKSQTILLESGENKAPLMAAVTCDPDIQIENDVFWYTILMGNGKPKPEDNEFNWWDIPAMCFNQDIDWNYHSVGCVINMAVQIALDLRKRGVSKAQRIILLGADFGPWGGYRRCPPNRLIPDFPVMADEKGWIKWDGRLTDPTGLIYKLTLMRLWAGSLAPIYSMSDGILTEFPRATFGPDGLNFPEYPDQRTVQALANRFIGKFADDFPTITQQHYDETEKAILESEVQKYDGSLNIAKDELLKKL